MPATTRPAPTTPGPVHHHDTPHRHDGRTVLALAFAAIVVAMTQTQLVPIPALLEQQLHTSAANINWATTAALLSAAVATPLLARVGDQYGKKRTLTSLFLLMIAGSLLAALTTSLAWLIVGRVLQGAATAMFPIAFSVVQESVARRLVPTALAVISAALLLGAGISMVATGLLTHGPNADYHAVFWLLAALSALALVLLVVCVPKDDAVPRGRVDWLGALTLGAFLVTLLLPVSEGGDWGWSSPWTIGLFCATPALAALWLITESRVRAPLVELRTFFLKPVAFTNLAGLFFGFGMFVALIGVSYIAQIPDQLTGYGFGASALRASSEYLLPACLGGLVVAPVAGLLARRLGPAPVLAAAGLIGAAGFVWLGLAHNSTFDVIAAGVLAGSATAMGYATMPSLIGAAAPADQTGIANGINSIARSVGSAVASAVITTLLTSDPVPTAVPGLSLPAEDRFTTLFLIAAGCFATVSLIAVTVLRTHDKAVRAR
ncbi:MFS transporter [Streptomyces fractus]|uniref:MFS transporter n=1 Tax=Streptomyces fractus TaxID=641806 RepID=UPI003CECC7EA